MHYTQNSSAGSLPGNQLMNMVKNPVADSILWISSLGSGLVKFNTITGKCRIYTTADGLPNNTIYAITADKMGRLWCSSNKGFFSFDPQTEKVQSFTAKDGLPGDEFNRFHYLQLPDGSIVSGGVDGYTVFNPLQMPDDAYQPVTAITGFSIANAPADAGYAGSPLHQAINSLHEMVLPYYQNFLTFEFAALEFNVTEKLQYRYRLQGFDDKWITTGTDNTATYTNIPPGHYTLKINATNTAGKWSSYVKVLHIIIRPPLILQPFIENAIWHGILPKEGGKVTVAVRPQPNGVQCTIDDNGIGRETSLLNKAQNTPTYQSKGMKLVQSRLQCYNVINNHSYSIAIIDKKDPAYKPAGTTVIVNFKKEV